MSKLPLCVDLDGTLLKTDTLMELTVRVLKQNPLLIFWLPVWLLRGKHILKMQLAQRCLLDPTLLPVNPAFLAFLRTEHECGRKLFLVTGAHETVARSIANHYGFFTDVFATDEAGNLTGKNKAALLVQKFGAKQFAYAGNDAVDFAVWEHAGECVLVNATPTVVSSANKLFSFTHCFDLRAAPSFKVLLKAMRLHQWAKNALIFVPLLAAHELLDPIRIIDTILAFVAFGCCASFSYIINDISDLDADRKHHSKFNRPFANGTVSIPEGVLLAGLLLAYGHCCYQYHLQNGLC